ncbi:Putative F-box domain-containing protein [Septoria linicola]|uniref:F-box domain-containing protein n=1 Tax=Septoria linicola TaxID=215465 RepID=A0A9Q9EQY3_9PEZI|nr:putative F-box domain-containing protein [Septoria linicola]USW59309.1 Putative F-box domain-containing protein [Septoria linicola]
MARARDTTSESPKASKTNGKQAGSTAHGFMRRSVFGIFKRRSAHNEAAGDSSLEPCARQSSIAEPMTVTLFSPPTELLLPIIKELSFVDLLNLRSACHKTQILLAKGDLLREWMLSRSLAHHETRVQTLPSQKAEPGSHMRLYMKLYPAPDPVTFEYLLNQNRRISRAVTLANALADLMEEYVLKHPDFWLLEGTAPLSPILFNSCPEYAQIQSLRVPCLLVIQHYLETLKGSMSELASSSWSDTTATWARVTDATFGRYDPMDLSSAHAMFDVLCWLMARLLDPSGHRARSIMVIGRRTLADADVRQFVVLSGLRGIAQLASLPSFRSREKAVKELARSHNPVRNKQWAQAWSDYRLEYKPVVHSSQALNVLNLEFGFHDVWMRAATDQLASHKLRPRGINILTADKPSRRTVDAYSDIAGYHMVQGLAW